MQEAIYRLNCYTISKQNGVATDKEAINHFFSLIIENRNCSIDSYLNCLAYITCYDGLTDELRKKACESEKAVYASLSQQRQLEVGDSPKVR